ncbi:hypothetical protein HAX54_037889 [Datura stramonium]|uniref:Uncharacterized protein n=1 Tax=Datura stramonium TaxID=4076 RepID=A0ABS8Y8Z2_DATST|nr:hypothetical protein [Datura stramonium]
MEVSLVVAVYPVPYEKQEVEQILLYQISRVHVKSNIQGVVTAASTEYFQEKVAFLGSKVVGLPAESSIAGALENLFSGKLIRHTSFPVRNRVVVNFRWVLRFPKVPAAEDPDTVILGNTGFPLLVGR